MADQLTYNPKNAVTKAIEREFWRGKQAVRKVLTRVNDLDTPVEWQASEIPSHWNFWLREWQVYQSSLSTDLRGSGVRLARPLELKRGDLEADLVLEDLSGRSGHALSWQDFALIAKNWGRAQGRLAHSDYLNEPWTSQQFLRAYTQSKPVNSALLEDNAVWNLPVISESWTKELREGLQFLYRHADALYDIMETAPQIPCHLDFWPNNVFIVDQEVVLVDWAFFGSGALGEDVGNFIPDAIFDGFVAGEDMARLETIMLEAYLAGLSEVRDIEWPVQTTLYASAVKYVWLAPLLLERAAREEYSAYGGGTITEQQAIEQYRSRGLALMRLCEWAEQALKP